MAGPRRVLIADLNNFSRYPTVAIGYLVAVLRRAGMEVEVFSPLQSGVTGVARETPPGPLGLLRERLAYRSAVSNNAIVRGARDWLAKRSAPDLARQAEGVAAAFGKRLDAFRPDAVLVSTYLMYQPLCRRMASACKARGVPVLIGGPYFHAAEVAADWIDIDGVSGIVGGEVEHRLPEIVEAMVAGKNLSRVPGIWTRGSDGRATWTPPTPLDDLDRLPFPDYGDFPWERYPNRIVPIITGRGCGWGACTFCSDITSTAGRTFRTRSPQNVLAEIEAQYRDHGTRLFAFVDLKLNSSPPMWDALLDRFQTVAPGAQWIAAVHVAADGQDGLNSERIRAAAAAGMVRLTTGLESGSQRVLDKMAKGTDLAMTSRVLRDARAAGISVRTTMIVGYPGEEAADVAASAQFVEQHADCIERVTVNRFQIMTGTHVHRAIERHPERFATVTGVRSNPRLAQLQHHYAPSGGRGYRREAYGLLRAAHRINRRPLMARAREFEGVM
jgi:radical SAM superfamily enzyme YgiQ (UPF0313 family)